LAVVARTSAKNKNDKAFQKTAEENTKDGGTARKIIDLLKKSFRSTISFVNQRKIEIRATSSPSR
jgi:hypothetical protein